MPVFLLKFATSIVGPRFARAAIYGVGALLLVLAIFAAVKIHDHSVIAAHEAKLEQRAKPATDQAAKERANDTIANAKNEEEMHNVIAAQPDQPISPTSHALSCERLRRAGRHSAACS
jgi:D-arabinose 1-dehydrogenase-like Zn-dependent alcohol dehydrogenase